MIVVPFMETMHQHLAAKAHSASAFAPSGGGVPRLAQSQGATSS
jgi:hypothetical protein